MSLGEENRVSFSSVPEENRYIWQRPAWPRFEWSDRRLLEPLASTRHKQGRLLGSMARLGFDLKLEAQLETVTASVLKTSEIEGEILHPAGVRSSVARHLGIRNVRKARADRRTEGVVAMMLDATEKFETPLTRERLFGWQAAMFPGGFSDLKPVRIGAWREDRQGPMQVVSGREGKWRVHFEAPPAPRIEEEMARFLEWFNLRGGPEGLLRAGLAHLWFLTIHPFEDGNGRVGRAIAEQALAQSESSSQRFYSLSGQLQKERSDYYDMLERTQKGTLDVTDWLVWFLSCLSRAIEEAESVSARVLKKTDFWQQHAHDPFSERQRKVLSRLQDGFDGKLTARKWAALAKCSVPTAQRDINDLVDRGVLRRNPGGSKNTSYDLVG